MSQTIKQALLLGDQLLAAITDNPRLEAEILLAEALKCDRSYLHGWPEHVLSETEAEIFLSFLKRRQNREPIAYILGKKEFWSLELSVDTSTLIPRPETELLVETVLAMAITMKTPLKIAELGTGSGAIALALAKEQPSWQIVATDISQRALEIAKRNTQQLAIKNVSFFQGNWCAALSSNHFDMIISNPPYLAESEWGEYAENLSFEPRNALVAGLSGLEAIGEICISARHFLKPKGLLLIEHGSTQGEAVRCIFIENGYKEVQTLCDLSKNERITFGFLE